jgi:TrmH family RNA methyltransferase
MITSVQNPIIKQFRALERSRERRKSGLTVVEGGLNLAHALNNGWQVQEVLYSSSGISSEDRDVLDRCWDLGIRVEEVSSSLLGRLSKREGPLGIVFSLKWQEKHTLDSLKLPSPSLVLVAESIEKPGNLGVLVRCAAAAGAHAVILCNPLTTFQDPSCIHASLGAVFSIPLVTTHTEECAKWLLDHSLQIVATTPSGKSLYSGVDMRVPTAIVMGNEHTGVSDKFLQAGTAVSIPMDSSMHSLNVSVAAAVFLFEAVRQRSLG